MKKILVKFLILSFMFSNYSILFSLALDEEINNFNSLTQASFIENDLNKNEDTEQNNSKTFAEKAFAPVGWAIGGTVAPLYLGAQYGYKAVEWSVNYIASPIYEKTVAASEYALYSVALGINYSFDYIVAPILDGTTFAVSTGLYGLQVASSYTIVPIAEGGFWVLKRSANGMITITKYTVKPLATTLSKTARFGCDYVLIPIGNVAGKCGELFINGGEKVLDYGVDYLIVPAGKGVAITIDKIGDVLYFGAKYTIVPMTRGLYWTLDKSFDGLKILSDYSITPIVYYTGWTLYQASIQVCGVFMAIDEEVLGPIRKGIVMGTKKMFSPIKNAIMATSKATVNGTRSVVNFILRKN